MEAAELAEYVLLATRISAAYPSYRINEATIADWTERLAEVDDIEHATRMAQRLRNLPSPPDPKDWQLARRDTREVDYTHALPPGPRAKVDELTPEERERWEALKARLREKPPGRSFPAALLAVPDADLDPPKVTLRKQDLCSGSGEMAVRINGVLCCPGCKEPLP